MGILYSLCCSNNKSRNFVYSPIAESELEVVDSAQEYCNKLLGNPIDGSYMDFNVLKDDALGTIFASHKFMFILRGPPGSGKSTLANALKSRFPSVSHHSADQFFYNLSSDGKSYAFNVERLPDAHSWCMRQTEDALISRKAPILVDNTNIKRWEVMKYTKLAKQYGYLVVVLQPQTPWFNDPDKLASRNIHNVPVEVIRDKLSNMDQIFPSYLGLFMLPDTSNNGRGRHYTKCNFANLCSNTLQELFSLPRVKAALNGGGWKNTNDCDIDCLDPAENRSPFHVTLFFIGRCNKPEVQNFVTTSEYATALQGIICTVLCEGFFLTSRTIGCLCDRMDFDMQSHHPQLAVSASLKLGQLYEAGHDDPIFYYQFHQPISLDCITAGHY
ncbi:hypothetical protein Ciccas_002369 [Cichlidogyrus casuarinus]|uniref:2',3'-cyclic-nucleotide 3'-phosphodiesterase n=1 Tax=Cichlidogyrus casuarinus TaxID=1844966 RepID=A0ABD2QHG7_9PLAT